MPEKEFEQTEEKAKERKVKLTEGIKYE